MTESKILNRIKKLLAMAKDASSPNEAAIAANRARKMMDKHQVSELNLADNQPDEFGVDRYYTKRSNKQAYLGVLAAAIAKLNDCHAIYKNEFSQKTVVFKGFKDDSELCVEMLKYLMKQCVLLANLNASGRTDIHAYKLGFASGVAAKVTDMMIERKEVCASDGRQLVVVKKALVEAQYGVAKFKARSTRYSGSRSAYSDGKVAGYNTVLNKQVGAS